MSLRRISVACLLGAVTLAASSATALAKPRVAHAHKLTGVVLAINAKRHTLKLRVHHGRAAYAAIAGGTGGRVVAVSFDTASVKSPDGAVSVGDDVTVTTTTGTSGAVATAIDVIGQPNGGDAGKGAAISGTVSAVDAAAGTLTLATGSSSVHVSVSSTTVLAVAGASAPASLNDVSLGDHIVVFTADATADPIVALGILDASRDEDTSSGGDQHSGALVSFGGTVQSVDTAASSVTVSVLKGALAGKVVTVSIGANTRLEADESGSDQTFSLESVAVGDRVSIGAATLDASPILAAVLYDAGPAPASDSGDGSDSNSSASSGDTHPQRFAATVGVVGVDGLTVTPTNGPLAGQTVRVSVTSKTSFEIGSTRADISQLQGDVAVGDTVEVYTLSETTTPILATGLIDYGAVTE